LENKREKFLPPPNSQNLALLLIVSNAVTLPVIVKLTRNLETREKNSPTSISLEKTKNQKKIK
jgi:hypothetical protein